MREQTIAAVNVATTKLGTTITDLKLRMAEHIITQDGCYGNDGVLNILAETKVGARRRADLLKKLEILFAVA